MELNLVESAARAAREQEIDFDEFVKRTASWWRMRAGCLVKRYVLPQWFDVQDANQELLLWAWTAVYQYDPSRGTQLGRYVDWNAMKRTVKTMQKVRGVEQHRRRGAPRFEIPMNRFPEDKLPPDPVFEPCSEQAAQREEEFRILFGLCETAEEHAVVAALDGGGEVEEIAERLFSVTLSRMSCCLVDEGHARSVVYKVLRGLAKKYHHTKESCS
jgi:hypothetical protein